MLIIDSPRPVPSARPSGTRSSGDGSDRCCCIPASCAATMTKLCSRTHRQIYVPSGPFCYCSNYPVSRESRRARVAPIVLHQRGCRPRLLVQIAAVVIGPSSEAHEPWIRQCLLSSEATNGIWIQEPEAIDEGLGCGVGCQYLENRISTFSQTAMIPGATSSDASSGIYHGSSHSLPSRDVSCSFHLF